MLEEIGMVLGELPSRDEFLGAISEAGNYAGLGGIIYWQVCAVVYNQCLVKVLSGFAHRCTFATQVTEDKDVDTMNFAYTGDGGAAVQDQIDWAIGRVCVPAGATRGFCTGAPCSRIVITCQTPANPTE